MSGSDGRSHAIAVLPGCLLNPGAERYRDLRLTDDELHAVVAAGYGLLVLPCHLGRDAEAGQGVSLVAQEVVEYVRRGYQVVVVALAEAPDGAVWRRRLARELAHWGLPWPDQIDAGPHGVAPSVLRHFLLQHHPAPTTAA